MERASRWARCSVLAWRKSAKRVIIGARVAAGVSLHEGKAALAARTARSTSVELAVWIWTLVFVFVAGLVTARVLVLLEGMY